MRRDKSFETRLQKTHLGATGHDEPAGHQPLSPPPCDGAGGDIVPPADLRHGQHRLSRMLHSLAHRGREVFHEQPEVVLHIAAVEHQGRPPVRAIAGDSIAQIIVRILFGWLDLAEKLLGTFHLLEPAVLRGVPRLLVLELLHPGMAIGLRHPQAPHLPCAAFSPPEIIPDQNTTSQPSPAPATKADKERQQKAGSLRSDGCPDRTYSSVKTIYFPTVQSRLAADGRRICPSLHGNHGKSRNSMKMPC